MNNNKTQLQEKEFETLRKNYRVLLKWATGCGKSKMTIDLINNALNTFSADTPVKVLFVIAEKAHKKNWEEEFKRWQLKKERTSIEIICYASLHKKADSSYDIIVFDEAHHLFTEKRMAAAETIHTSYVYALSATLSSAHIDMLESIFGKFAISTVTLQNAIDKDILPNPKIFVIGLDLDPVTVNQEIVVGKNPTIIVDWEHRFKYKGKNVSYTIKCTEMQKYIYITNDIEYWKRRYEFSRNAIFHNRWVNCGSQRKRFLGELKTDYLKQIISGFSKKTRYVCFCASINQATTLSKANTISSKKTSKHNQAIIDAFNNKSINSIYAVGMITEGMNLKDIQVGVIAQLDGKERLFIQKFGRSLRADDPVTVIFYYRNTQDEIYLKKALENIDEKYVEYRTFNNKTKIVL